MKSKIVFIKALSFEHKALEEYLEKQALKGWKLKSAYGGYLKFNKVEPKNIKYTIEVLDVITAFHGENSDESLNLREYCEKVGWKFICEWEKLQIYCNDSGEDLVPISTDEHLKFKQIVKSSSKAILINILIALMLSINIFNQFVNVINPYGFTSNISLIAAVVVLFLVGMSVSDLIRYINFNIKANKSLKVGEPIEYPTYKALKRKRNIDTIGLILAIALLLVIFTGDDGMAIKAIKFLVIYSIVVFIVYKGIGKLKLKNKAKKLIITIIYVGIPLILVMSWVRVIFMDAMQVDKYNGKARITSEDFGLGVSEEPYYSISQSVVASYENYNDTNLSYEVFKSNYKWINSYYFNRRMKRYEKINLDYTLIKSDKNKNYEVYENKEMNSFIMVTPDKIIELRLYNNDIDEKMALEALY